MSRNLAIASLVFLNAGVLLIFLINLILCKKAIFRTHYTYFTRNPGKKQAVKKSFAGVCLLLLPLLAITITGAIQSKIRVRFLCLGTKLTRFLRFPGDES